MSAPINQRTIPLEIIEHIVDQFGDSLLDLKTCSLVCRDWLPRARHHLFRSISLPVEENNLTLISTSPSPHRIVDTESILDILHSSPHLIAHIQKLTLDFRYSLRLVCSSEPWLVELARMMNHLRRLVLFMFPIYNLSPKMQRVLPELLNGNTLLDTIVIDSCVFRDAPSFWTFLRHTAQLPNLRHLVLIGVVLKNVPSARDVNDIEQSTTNLERTTGGKLTTMAQPTKLSTLELGQMSVFPLFSAMFNRPNGLFDLTTLSRVKIRDIGALFFYADLWPVVGSSITHLDFEVGKYVRDEYVEPQFMSFTALTHLTLSVTACRLHLPNLLTVLSHIHLISSLQHLYIVWPQLRNTWDLFSDFQGCDALDSILAGLPESIKGLKLIVLEMRCHCPWQAPFEDGYEREMLARTEKTGILDLKVLEISGYTMYGEPVFPK
ncbi:hypothetical protein E1B28_001707 [Marasmius oreades]|uniref:F-box domain-containing protein n=1 Tax=Marasmius oreades TaxID=181124 RepID=A0A9P7V3Z2_9AGAR|nr:uncharacterized protein E1B28_001707 [Marasmius oreades]KAG7099909.1 hypothetical protein E1B28_001707 [Marasmius oreades]